MAFGILTLGNDVLKSYRGEVSTAKEDACNLEVAHNGGKGIRGMIWNSS